MIEILKYLHSIAKLLLNPTMMLMENLRFSIHFTKNWWLREYSEYMLSYAGGIKEPLGKFRHQTVTNWNISRGRKTEKKPMDIFFMSLSVLKQEINETGVLECLI